MIHEMSIEAVQSLKQGILDAKYIIFDFDDTLVLSMHLWDQLDETCVKKLNLDINLDQYRDKLHGMTMDTIAQFMKDEFKLKQSQAELKQLWLDTMQELFEDVQLIDGAKDFLSLLQNLPNKPKIGVASASSTDFVQILAQKLNIMQYVDVITSCDEHNISKPDPDVFYTSLEKLGYIDARTEQNGVKNVIIFEDSIPGLTAAKRVNKSKVVALVVRGYKIDEKASLSDWQMKDYKQIVGEMKQQ